MAQAADGGKKVSSHARSSGSSCRDSGRLGLGSRKLPRRPHCPQQRTLVLLSPARCLRGAFCNKPVAVCLPPCRLKRLRHQRRSASAAAAAAATTWLKMATAAKTATLNPHRHRQSSRPTARDPLWGRRGAASSTRCSMALRQSSKPWCTFLSVARRLRSTFALADPIWPEGTLECDTVVHEPGQAPCLRAAASSTRCPKAFASESQTSMQARRSVSVMSGAP